MQMLSDDLIKVKGLFNVIELSLSWAARAGTNKAIFTKDVHPLDWFGFTTINKVNREAYLVWSNYLNLADRDIKDFNKVDDVRELITQFLTVRGLKLEDYKSIPENIFFNIYKKNGLKSKQMEALLKLYA